MPHTHINIRICMFTTYNNNNVAVASVAAVAANCIICMPKTNHFFYFVSHKIWLRNRGRRNTEYKGALRTAPSPGVSTFPLPYLSNRLALCLSFSLDTPTNRRRQEVIDTFAQSAQFLRRAIASARAAWDGLKIKFNIIMIHLCTKRSKWCALWLTARVALALWHPVAMPHAPCSALRPLLLLLLLWWLTQLETQSCAPPWVKGVIEGSCATPRCKGCVAATAAAARACCVTLDYIFQHIHGSIDRPESS